MGTKRQVEEILSPIKDSAVAAVDSEESLDAELASTSKTAEKRFSPRKRFAESRINQKICSRCGYDSSHKRCPAEGKQCSRCKRYGHFVKSGSCRARNIQSIEKSSEKPERFLRVLRRDKRFSWTVGTKILGKNVWFKLDAGADVTAVPASLMTARWQKFLVPTNVNLSGPSRETLKVVGMIKSAPRLWYLEVKPSGRLCCGRIKQSAVGAS